MMASGNEGVQRGAWLIAVLLLVGLPTGAAAQDGVGEDGAGEAKAEAADSDSRGAGSVEELPEAQKKELLRLLETAKTAYADGRFRDAIPKLKRAYEIHPDPKFQYRIALSYERSNQVREAIEHYERFLQEAPDTDMRGKVERTLTNLRARLKQASEDGDEQGAHQEEPGDEGGAGKAPLVLTAIGGVSTAAAVTFGVLNLNTRQQRSTLLDEERTTAGLTDKERLGRRQNLYAGLTYGSVALAAASFTGVAIALIKQGQGDRQAADSGVQPVEGASLRLRFAVQPGWLGIDGEF